MKTLVTLAQKRGVAVLIADDANLARMFKADGLHLSWSKDIVKAYREARDTLGERAMIGADAGRSRDDAMQLGEDGADYIAFGIPPHVEDRATAEDRQLDLIAWWSEIFEMPCVAFDVSNVEHARELAGDGADFIAVTITTAQSLTRSNGRITAFDGRASPSRGDGMMRSSQPRHTLSSVAAALAFSGAPPALAENSSWFWKSDEKPKAVDRQARRAKHRARRSQKSGARAWCRRPATTPPIPPSIRANI